MELKDFKGIHSDKKILVCASGISMQEITAGEYLKITEDKEIILLGVSHVNRFIQTDYLICVDREKEQVGNDYDFIRDTNSKFIFSCRDDKELYVRRAKKIMFKIGKKDGVSITDESIDHTCNTAYMACLLAFYMGAKKVGMIGNDFVNHHNAKNEFGRIYLNKQYLNLYNNFNVPFVNLSDKSLIKTIPYQSVMEF